MQRQHQPSEGSTDLISLQSLGVALAAPTGTTTSEGPSLSSLASGATVQLPPNATVPKQKTLRRNSLESVSSVMTDSSSNVQRLRLGEAVKRAGETENTQDIVDMLLTLKRKERSLCLFNPDFLKSKIKLAKEALELFVEDSAEAISPMPTGLSSKCVSVDSKEFERYFTSEQCRVLQSNYNNTATQKSVSPTGHSNGDDDATHSEIDSFLASIQDFSLFEKKQKLGDRLFPLVKVVEWDACVI